MSTCEAQAEETQPDSVKRYKLWLLEARQMRADLRQQIGRRIYRMMKLLIQAFDDPEFRADNGNADDFQAGAVLDDFVYDDTGLEFLQLRAMVTRYPKESAWRDGRLQKMHAAMLEDDRAKQVKPRRERSPALTKAEYDAVARAAERQRVMLMSANEQLQAASTECERKQTELERLRDRVVELENENAILRAQIVSMGGIPGGSSVRASY